MTDQPAPEGMPAPSGDPPAGDAMTPEPPPLAPIVAAAAASATPPPVPPPAPMAAPAQPVAPPPAVAWQAPPPAVAVKGKRTALAMVAGILLLLLAIGGGLIGIGLIVFGSAIISSLGDSVTNIPGYNGDPAALVTGFFVFFAVIILAYSLAYLLAGIGVLRNSNWARVLGIVVGIISGLLWLSALTGGGNGGSGGGLFSLVLFAMHAYIVVVLLFFWRSKATA
jgi:hypothetical protein